MASTVFLVIGATYVKISDILANVTGGENMMIYGSVVSHSVERIAFMTLKMNSLEYQRVVEDHILLSLKEQQLGNAMFMQEIASVHTSYSTRAWFEDNNITRLL